MRPIIVAVSGILGSNAAAICSGIAKRIERSTVLRFEDFPSCACPNAGWLENDGNFNRVNVGDIKAALDCLIVNKKLDCVIMDFPFGRSVEALSPYIDFVFYLEDFPDLALARQLGRQLRSMSTDLLRTKLRLYCGSGHKIIRKIERVVPRSADMVLKAGSDPDEVEELICQKLKAMLINRWIIGPK